MEEVQKSKQTNTERKSRDDNQAKTGASSKRVHSSGKSLITRL